MSPPDTLPSIQESGTKPTSENITEVDIENDIENENASHYMPKKRKKTSKVWLDFKEVVLANGKANQTAKGQQTLTITKSITQSETVTSVQNFKYDHAKVREVLSHMIIVHELPFHFSEYELFNFLMKTATPHYEKISRATVRNDCITSFELEKKKLMLELKDVKRISVTTDLWKSDQNISYMVVTGHYVDAYWNLQKRTLNFCNIPPPHSRLAICDVLNKCLVEWGIERKVWTVTVDNASNNDVVVRTLQENLSYDQSLPLSGKIFHVNILVQDGLSAIQETISKVRDSVKHVIASEMRTIMFSEIAKQLKLSSKKLVLDCCTRWNATYYMLSAALEFKDVFPRYQQRDASYTSLPSEEEWKKVKLVCSFLKEFEELTKLVSGSEYPTANLFLPELVIIRTLLQQKSHEIFMQEMLKNMNKKFDKYWGSCNLLLCMAAVLDPRNKMRVIGWCVKDTYSEVDGVVLVTTVRETLRNLYNEYVVDLKSIDDENLSEVQGIGYEHVMKSREKLEIKRSVSRRLIWLESFIMRNGCLLPGK
ncbi:hypothetical protein C2S51_015755 [Perilla frutescens var. frutescens]|nr:hypothetical protein C2S51_015755 [Perilla frutescens var. frutescens]